MTHIIVTFAFAAMVWITVTVIGFVRHGVSYLRLFAPAGVPIWLMPVIIPIELISYLIRLFANMMAGHTMLKASRASSSASGLLAGVGAARFLGCLHRPRISYRFPASAGVHGADLHLLE